MTAVKRLKRKIRDALKKLRRDHVRRFHSFGPEQLAAAIGQVGIQQGDTVLVHVSWDGFEAFQGKVTDLLSTLRITVGPEGTLLMPTMSFSGSAIDYAREHPVVNMAQMPSRMGLPTELFRRQPDVLRSIHPTHPVAVWGAHADEIIADHHLCRTPCGRQSPFGRLLDYDGRILFLGTGIEVMTFFHAVEDILETELPQSPFTEEEFALTTVTADGRKWQTRMRLFDRELSRRRRISAVVPILKRAGAWRSARVGTLPIIALDAVAVLEAVRQAVREGVSLYGSD